MIKRLVVTLSFMAALIAALAFVKFKQFQAGAAQAAAFQPPPEAITTTVAADETWPSEIRAIGTVTAHRGVTVSADLPGVVVGLSFDSGAVVAPGFPLVQLDTRQERAQLEAAEAQEDLAAVNLTRATELHGQGILSGSEFDRLKAEHAQAVARVGEVRAAIDRKQVRAPFAGVLGLRQVNLGQYLNAGDAVVTLQALDPIHVDFTLPQQEAGRLRPGAVVRVSAEGEAGGVFEARVSALDAIVDAATRNRSVRATLANGTGRLRPGMFVQVEVPVAAAQRVVALPASAVHYAPYGDSVFVVDAAGGSGPRSVRQQFVKVAGTRGDLVGLAEGVRAGEEIATSGVFKLRNGAAVHVDNTTRPSAAAAPRPEDN